MIEIKYLNEYFFRLFLLLFFAFYTPIVSGQIKTVIETTKTDHLGGVNVQSGWSAPVFGDLDKDGDIDVVVGSADGTISYFENHSYLNARFTRHSGDKNPFDKIDAGMDSQPALVDLDKDGDLDLVIGYYCQNKSTAFLYYVNKSKGSNLHFEKATTNPFKSIKTEGTDIITSPAFVDIDGDGDFDLIASTAKSKFRLYRNETNVNSDIQFSLDNKGIGKTLPTFESRNVSPLFCDINNDGLKDFVFSSDGGEIFYCVRESNSFGPRTKYKLSLGDVDFGRDSGFNLAYADLDNDGIEDMYLGNREGSILKCFLLYESRSPLFVERLTTSSISVNGVTNLIGATTISDLTTTNIANLNGGTKTTDLTATGTTSLKGHTKTSDLQINGNLTFSDQGQIFTSNMNDANWRIGHNNSNNVSGIILNNKKLNHYNFITYPDDGVHTDDAGFVIGQNDDNSSMEISGNHESFFRGDMQLGNAKQNEQASLNVTGNLAIGTDIKNAERTLLFVNGETHINAGMTVEHSATVKKNFYVIDTTHSACLRVGVYKPMIDNASATIIGNTYMGSEKSYLKRQGKSFPKGYTLWVDGDIGINGDIENKDGVLGDLEDAWPDFVFDEDYDLPGVAELKKSIARNGHLPYMLSAMDVKENGYGLHDMNKRLLRTVEELTLHTIQQEEKIQDLQIQFDMLKQLIISSNK